MIDHKVFAEIRRLFFAEHLPVGTIANQLGVSKDAVRRAIGSDAFNQRKAGVARSSVLDAFKPYLIEQLERYPRLRATRLHDMIRDRGYPGSAVVVRRFLAEVRGNRAKEAFLRRTTLPGEEAQVDWAHFGKVRVGRAERPLVAFVLVLGYCRALFVRFFHDLTTPSFLEGHVRAFDAIGGVPRRILYDNLKSVVTERFGDAIRFSDDILHCAAHYHFEPRPCAPYRGNEKGKVERAIRYVREAFFEGRAFGSIDDLHAQLASWIEATSARRVVTADPERRTVAELLALERPLLLPLPSAPFPAERIAQIVSGKTPYLRFDLNDYSIPPDRVGVPLVLRATQQRVRITDARGLVVAEHARSFDSGARVEDRAHIAMLHSHKRHASELRGRDQLIARCPAASALLARQIDRQLHVPAEVRALLLLCERHGDDVVDEAIHACLAAGLARASDVERAISSTPQPMDLADGDPVDLSDYDFTNPKKDDNR